jgi:hypothetical protein
METEMAPHLGFLGPGRRRPGLRHGAIQSPLAYATRAER